MTEKVNLHDCRTYGGQTYGPGTDVEIPEEMKEALEELAYFERSASLEEQEAGGLFEGLSNEQVESLRAGGFGNEAAIAEAEVSDLVNLEHIGTAAARKLKERAADDA